jgi:hypothetical protein
MSHRFKNYFIKIEFVMMGSYPTFIRLAGIERNPSISLVQKQTTRFTNDSSRQEKGPVAETTKPISNPTYPNLSKLFKCRPKQKSQIVGLKIKLPTCLSTANVISANAFSCPFLGQKT